MTSSLLLTHSSPSPLPRSLAGGRARDPRGAVEARARRCAREVSEGIENEGAPQGWQAWATYKRWRGEEEPSLSITSHCFIIILIVLLLFSLFSLVLLSVREALLAPPSVREALLAPRACAPRFICLERVRRSTLFAGACRHLRDVHGGAMQGFGRQRRKGGRGSLGRPGC